MMVLDKGMNAPDFSLPDASGDVFSLQSAGGKALVLYFYPRDDTPGCTIQACGFRDEMADFTAKKAVIWGVSADDGKSHQKFTDKFSLNFPLLADTSHTVCEDYGCWVEKSMYGKKYMGIDRATFLIDGAGIIQKIWRKVKVPGHVDEVMAAVKALEGA